MNDRPKKCSSSAGRAGSLLAAPPAVLDDALVASRAADTPVMEGGMEETEVRYESSGNWMVYVERT
jgi:hypothetical protein